MTGGLRSWRSELPAEDAERFDAAAGGLVDELGYPRASSPGRANGAAARLRDDFAAEVRSRGRPLPEGWGPGA